ncbi:hypothetical protein [Chryseobacterium sp. G0186]|uniref:hypothetical protein n=1 Tax=Chryseobacterium sp. G0186 TaxID=2487064 RepID=UPI000F4E88E9|nr:hypothetical protein [Chryseobacterium sp. G0186]
MKKLLFASLCALTMYSCHSDQQEMGLENQASINSKSKNSSNSENQKNSQEYEVKRYYSHNLMKHYFGAETLPYSGSWVGEGLAFRTSKYHLGAGSYLPMVIMVNPVNQDMVIAITPADREEVEKRGYIFREVIGYPYPATNNTFPVYRYYRASKNGHFYTKNFGELGYGGGDWKYEGIAFYAL